jgi:hypothetical protein
MEPFQDDQETSCDCLPDDLFFPVCVDHYLDVFGSIGSGLLIEIFERGDYELASKNCSNVTIIPCKCGNDFC